MTKTGDEGREPGQHTGSRADATIMKGSFPKGAVCGLKCMRFDVFT